MNPNYSPSMHTEEHGRVVLIYLSGAFDEQSGIRLLEEVKKWLNRKSIRFVVDFSQTRSMSSPAVANVIEIGELVHNDYVGKVVFSGLSPLNLKVFEMVGILKPGNVFSTSQEAEAEAAKDE